MAGARPCPCSVCDGKIPQLPNTRRSHIKRHPPAASTSGSSSHLVPIPSTPASQSPTPTEDAVFPHDDQDQHWTLDLDEDVSRAAFIAYEDDVGSDAPSILSLDSQADFGSDRGSGSSSLHYLDSDDDLSDPEEDEEEDCDVQVLENAPNYISREQLFAEAELDDEEDPDDNILPPAFSEPRSFRNAYIHVFANATFHGATHLNSKIHLDSVHSALSSSNCADDLSSFARTLATVERRLGLNVDDSIIYFFVCPDCWKRHHPSELSDPDFSSTCSREGCSGTLYTIKRTASSREKRTPTKVMPFFPPNIAIQRMMVRPAKYQECGHWRKPEDHGASPPISLEDWMKTADMDSPLEDIHDGWRWRNIPAFLKREWDDKRRNLADVPLFKSPPRFVSLPCGLLLTISIDWYS